MGAGGDNSTGSGGSWTVQDQVVVTSDNIGSMSQDRACIDEVCSIINSSGKHAISGEINPSAPYHMNNQYSNTTIFAIVGGVCWGTAIDYKHTLSGQMEGKGNNVVWGYLTGFPGACTMDNIKNLKRYAHDWYYGDIARGEERNQGSAEIVESYGGWVAGPDAKTLAELFLTGKGGGSASSASINPGTFDSGAGKEPQFWNKENFNPYEEISFTNFRITEEYPRIKTAEFTSRQKIELMSGRVAVIITGDCNDFGGIIISRDYDSTNKLYKYQCQGFMDRIMANPVYVVANGSKTVHQIIKEDLAIVGLPDVNLLEADEYDTAVSDETKAKMAADSKLAETSEIFKNKTEYKANLSTDGVDANPDDKDDDSKVIKTVTQTTSSTEEGDIRNPFKRKPTGIYDCETRGDFIRTLIFDYGVNVDFYGDINGIPHFDIIDFEAWCKMGWYIEAEHGFDSDYQTKFDITNIVTQVGIKNIQAINYEGELYTSTELLGINLEKYVGRMGTIEENPNASLTFKEGGEEDEEDEIDQLKTVYQDSTGRKYNKAEIFSTNGEPSCRKCSEKNGGLQPIMKKYSKSWINKCPACGSSGTLKDKSSEGTYRSVCSKCSKSYCQYCGYEGSNGYYQLTEVFKTKEETISKQSTDKGGKT